MPLPTTETRHPSAAGLDMKPLAEAAGILHASQAAALAAVAPAIAEITRAAELMADALMGSGRLIYVAAGSSGLMALADAAELGATFGIPEERILLHMAGGIPTDARMPGATEDDVASARQAAAGVRADDVILALSASGTTPYPLAFIEAARASGAKVISIANNAGTPLLDAADVPVLLATPPEVISGSTRLGAGTAQKVALNMMSTLMGIALGHVHDGMMVNVVADNIKLRKRAAGIVAEIAGVPLDRAATCLDAAAGSVKQAVLLAAGAPTPETAAQHLETFSGRLRPALAELGHS